MYNDSTFNGLFTGALSGGEWEYPTAEQNLVVVFPSFCLSAKDGDFTSDGVTITSEICDSEDVTIGNAPAQVFTATLLNPSNAMGSLPWSDGKVYIGVVTASAAADTYNSWPCHVYVNSVHWGLYNNRMYRGTSSSTLNGTPKAVIVSGNTCLYITETAIGYYNGSSFSTVSSPTAVQAYQAAKYRVLPGSVGVAMDSNGCPNVYNNVETNTKQTFAYIPMGVFDFNAVNAYGITFQVEAYDKMTVFDADATDWAQNLDFSSPKSFVQLVDELTQQFGLSYSIDYPGSGNPTAEWETNPLLGYSVTFRQIVKWIAEALGTNAVMYRNGELYFHRTGDSATPDATVSPDTIISGTRVVAQYVVPPVYKLIVYTANGQKQTTWDPTINNGEIYYIVDNPLFDPVALGGVWVMANVLSNIQDLTLDDVGGYRPTSVSASYADPRIDIADIVSIGNTDGTAHSIPLMRQVLTWNGVCQATYVASGNPSRIAAGDTPNTAPGDIGNTNPIATTSATCQEVHVADLDNPTDTVDIQPDGISLSNGASQSVDISSTEITIDDGINTTVLTAGIGQRVHSDTSLSLTSGTSLQNLASFELTTGTWMVSISVRFASNATGRRAINMATSSGGSAMNLRWGNGSAAVNGAYTYLHMASSVVITGNRQIYYINGYQNSGSSLTTEVAWDAVRVY